MEPENQREIDKAHGALGYAQRVAAATEEAAAGLEAKVARLDAELTNAQLALNDAKEAVADAHAELAVREADPLLALPSSKGGGPGPDEPRTTTLVNPDPATGSGGN